MNKVTEGDNEKQLFRIQKKLIDIYIIQEDKEMDLTKVLSVVKSKKTGFFAAGVLFGTAGIKALSSKDAKKLYTNCTAAVLRAKECVMDTVTTVQENAEDIYEEAKQINEERAAAEEEMNVYATEAEDEETVEASEDDYKEVEEVEE